MKKVFQKNQMIIMTLAVVIAVAGYVNYSQKYESAGTKNGKTKTVSKNVAKESAAAVTDDVTDVGEAVLTNAQVSSMWRRRNWKENRCIVRRRILLRRLLRIRR